MASIHGVLRSCTVLYLITSLFLIFGNPLIQAAPEDAGHTHLIFEDGFEEDLSDAWEMWAPPDAPPEKPWAVLYEAGNNFLSLEGSVIAIIGDPAWSNYTLEARVRIKEGRGEGHLNVRMGEPAPRYFVRLPQEGLYLTKEYLGEFTDLSYMDFELVVDAWHLLRVTCEGNTFSVYVDGELKIGYGDTEDPVLGGRVGLEGSEDIVIHFDDVRVYTSHQLYLSYLVEDAQDAINDARMADADTREAEELLEKGRVKIEEEDLSGAEALLNDAILKAAAAQPGEPADPSGDGLDSLAGMTWSVELIAGIISIGAAALGIVGWMTRTRSTRRKSRILFKKMMEEIDDVYSHFKMNARRCEAELLRIKGDVIAGFKDGLIEEEGFHTLDARIDEYVKEVRKEIEKSGE